MILEQRDSGSFIPHPEGIWPAVCVDVIDLGMCRQEFQGTVKMVPKIKLVFESGARLPDGTVCTVARNFTASLHVKARLTEFLSKWRGAPVGTGEKIELDDVIGASCVLVVSHQQNTMGKVYASIDAVSKPTQKVAPSGTYDGGLARSRIAEWQAKQRGAAPAMAAVGAAQMGVAVPQRAAVPAVPPPAPASHGGFGQVQPAGVPVAAVQPARVGFGQVPTVQPGRVLVAPAATAAAPVAGADDSGEDDVPF